MYTQKGDRIKCQYCYAGLYSSQREKRTCRACSAAVCLIERAWPGKKITPELVAKVKKQRTEHNSVHPPGWSETKKESRRLLRKRKQICRDRFMGREVKYTRKNYEGSPKRGKVTDVRIRDGSIQYVLDTRPRGIKVHELGSFEVVEEPTECTA